MSILLGSTVASTPGCFIADGSTVAIVIKSSTGVLKSLNAFNIGAVPFYLSLFDSATDPGTSGASVWSCGVPISTTAADGGANSLPLPPSGIVFVNGIVLHVHSGFGDADETAVVANKGLVSWAYN